MTDTFRALCAELATTLAERIDDKGDAGPYYTHAARLLDRARAALAKPADAPAAVAERPSDEELRDPWSWAAGQDQGPWPTQYHCFARAVLARWGRPTPQPVAEGAPTVTISDLLNPAYEITGEEIAEGAQLVDGEWLNPLLGCDSLQIVVDNARAALARWGRPAAAPVPVSERLPGPEDCDEQGRYWGLVMGCEAWVLAKGNPRLVCITHWLPANALPLPAREDGEVQP